MSGRVPRIRYQREPIPVSNGPIYAYRYEGLLASEGHYRKPSGAWSGGGPLYVHKESLLHGTMRAAVYRNNGVDLPRVLAGCVGTPSVALPVVTNAFINKAIDDAGAYALRGYNRTKPGRPLADLFVSGKELISDGLPTIPFGGVLFGKKGPLAALADGIPLSQVPGRIKDALRDLSGLGKEYLNAVFGWKPLVRDLQKLYGAMKNVDAAVNKLASQNGQNVRRRAVLENAQTATQTETIYSSPYVNVFGAPPNWFGNTGRTRYTVTTRTSLQVWYSACYRYWIPNLPAWKQSWGPRAKLFGANPTPGAVYSAMPWSWLADWFTDIGEIADALSPTAVDGLTMRYGYTMRHDTYEVEAASYVSHPSSSPIKNSLGEFGGKWDSCDHTFRSTYKRERKLRTGGIQPFGPGVTWGDITPSRAAILAALGLSRGDLKL